MARKKVVKKMAKKGAKKSKSAKQKAKKARETLVVAGKVKGYLKNIDTPAQAIAGLSARRSKRKPKQLEVPKLPAIFQQRLDELTEESKHRELTQAEQSSLDEMLDYVDDRTAYELEKLIRVQAT